MSKNKNTYRDIIYFNGDKVSSILAQLNRGLIDSMITTNLTADSATEKSEESKALELIGFSVDSNGSFSKINSLGLQEVKTLHDFALTKVLDTLPFKNVSNLDRTTLNSNSDRTFVLVSGIFSIYDYANFSELLGKINIIDKLFDNPINKGNVSIDSFSKFVREA
ncbi:hypothetical protein FZD47_05435 [Bacillus infantis]|uniref:Uncharacterized protein n=1 Tax=Bacillus infantis TaxID=324767 RepID=A0A5D4SN41_9BACI|nr:hypothetical protein [Bacillus infantis]TYS64815.1 hypothetical protein FZD47_05435 [Bacillus infantis]